jgi:hypothetical protein
MVLAQPLVAKPRCEGFGHSANHFPSFRICARASHPARRETASRMSIRPISTSLRRDADTMDNDRLQALLTWFRREGGRLDGARICEEEGRLALVATRDLAAADVVLRVPRRVLLTMDCARYSTMGARLIGAGVTRVHSLMSAFLVESSRTGGHWRLLADAMSGTFPDRPAGWHHADWSQLSGSDTQRLSNTARKEMRDEWLRVNEALPHSLHIAWRDFEWGWNVSVCHSFSLALGSDSRTQNAIAPFGEGFVPSLSPNCSFTTATGPCFEITTKRAVAAGTKLSLFFGALSDAELLARYGLCLGDNAHNTARLTIELGADHWLHEAAPALTRNEPAPSFNIGTDMSDARGWRLWSLLRLLALPNAQALREHPELHLVNPERVPALDVENERAAVGMLRDACAAALGAFDGGTSGDDELALADPALSRRHRLALQVRLNEKRILEQWKSVAHDAHRLSFQTSQDRHRALLRRSRDEGAAAGARGYYNHLLERLSFVRRLGAPVQARNPEEMENTLLNSSEKTLAAWFRQEGGRINGAAFGVRNGLRGLFANRDIRKGDVVMHVPRHLYLTVEGASHTALGLRLKERGPVGTHTMIGMEMIRGRHNACFWAPMINATPGTFDGRPENWQRPDWNLLAGSAAQRLGRSYWRYMVRQFKLVRNALPRHERPSLRDFRWAYQASATRTFTLTIDGHKTCGMVPLAEMFNHAIEPNCQWGGDHSRHFDITAKRDIAEGTELTITYGRVPGTRLLGQYGFFIDDNPHDTATLAFTAEAGHWLHGFARVLTDGRYAPEFEIGTTPDCEATRKTLSFLRLATLPNAEAAQAHPLVKQDALANVPMLDIASERSALLRLIEACERNLAGFACGTDGDDELLASGTLDWKQTFAVKVRRSEKRILLQTLEQARSAVVALYLPEAECRAALERRAAEAGVWKAYYEMLRDRLLQPA